MRSARSLFVAIMGAWMGAAGIEHGVGEFLQGNIRPEGVMILSWPHSTFFQIYNGEPAMTILPNMKLTGLLAIGFSLLFAIGAIFFSRRKSYSWILILLAIPMLLFGGGIFPPILGMLIGVAGSIPVKPARHKEPRGITRFIGLSWRWIMAACCISWLVLLPGAAALNFFIGVNSVSLMLIIMLNAFFFLFLGYWSSIQHDRLMVKKLNHF